jgi:hypothetical protein
MFLSLAVSRGGANELIIGSVQGKFCPIPDRPAHDNIDEEQRSASDKRASEAKAVASKEINSSPYESRPIRFIELWRHGDWKLKVYGIAYGRATPRPELIEAVKQVAADRLVTLAQSVRHYSVGFLGIHDGRTSNFVFVDWWADENELHHHVYVSPTDEPKRLTYATPTG